MQLMVGASVFRDRTQIVLPKGKLSDDRDFLARNFMITISEEKNTVCLLSSLCEIPKVRT
jgi:hypothetical protein